MQSAYTWQNTHVPSSSSSISTSHPLGMETSPSVKIILAYRVDEASTLKAVRMDWNVLCWRNWAETVRLDRVLLAAAESKTLWVTLEVLPVVILSGVQLVIWVANRLHVWIAWLPLILFLWALSTIMNAWIKRIHWNMEKYLRSR